jgi:cleavage and polyadenylation specificity factor subunit 2
MLYGQHQQQQRKRIRDEKLMLDSILKALRNNGDVLVCTDTAGRVLELVHLLDQLWKREDTGLLAYSLAWLNHVSISVAGFAKSQVEWMNDKIVRSFEEVRYNPFQFKHVKLCSSMDEVYAINGPKLIVTSTPDMEYGFSRELFFRLCGNENNLIMFTMRASPGTFARSLIDNPDQKRISVEIRRKVRLEGTYRKPIILKIFFENFL